MGNLERLKTLLNEIDVTSNIMSTLSWDMRVNLPPKAAFCRADAMSFLSAKLYQMKTSPELFELCSNLTVKDNDFLIDCMIKKSLKEYKKLTEIPSKLYSDFAAHNLKTELIWQEARSKNDYSMLKDNLEKEFEYKRQFAACHGYDKNPMDGLIDEYDMGMSTEKIDKIFDELKISIKDLLSKINESGIIHNKSCIFGKYPHEAQRRFCKEVAGTLGFSFQAGRLDESAHPYTTGNNKYDIRMTTRYFEDNFTSAAISTMHETGHSIYAQNHSDELTGTLLNKAPSQGWSEGIARFYENMIGRSKSLWSYFLPIAKNYFSNLEGKSLDEFYNSLNAVYSDPLRLNADEITYNLHIIIRYELEKMIFAGELSFDELPEAWNQKYKDYLGITPINDTEGILQDMHWASGFIGYFQNYVLGNCYDGHILNKMKNDIPDMFNQIENGRFDNILEWQTSNIFTHGSLYDPAELLMRTTSEQLSATHYIKYLYEKYSAIYKF